MHGQTSQPSDIVAVAGVGLVAALLMLPGLVIGPSVDAAVFLTVGRELAEGGVMYMDAWDHKPPGIHGLAALAHVLGGGGASWTVLWIASFLAAWSLGLILLSLLSRTASRRVALGVALLSTALAAAYPFALGGGMTETFAAPLAAGAVLVAATGGGGLVTSVGAGALAGMAAMFSPLALAIAIPMLILSVASRRPIASGGLMLLGLALVAAVVISLLTVSGALVASIDATVTFNQSYVAAGGIGDLSARASVRYATALLPLIIPAAGMAIGWRRVPAGTRPLGVAAGTWLLAAVGLVVVARQTYGHYLVLVIPSLAALASLGASVQRPSSRAQRHVALAAGAILAAASGTMLVSLTAEELESTQAVTRVSYAAAATVRDHSNDDDRILVWGNAAQVYMVSDRRPSSRYPYLAPLMTRGYTTPEMIDDEVARTCTDPPRLVVDAGSLQSGAPGMPPLLIEREILQPQRRIDLLDPLRAVIAEHYELVSGGDGYPIYELRTSDTQLTGESCVVGNH